MWLDPDDLRRVFDSKQMENSIGLPAMICELAAKRSLSGKMPSLDAVDETLVREVFEKIFLAVYGREEIVSDYRGTDVVEQALIKTFDAIARKHGKAVSQRVLQRLRCADPIFFQDKTLSVCGCRTFLTQGSAVIRHIATAVITPPCPPSRKAAFEPYAGSEGLRLQLSE